MLLALLFVAPDLSELYRFLVSKPPTAAFAASSSSDTSFGSSSAWTERMPRPGPRRCDRTTSSWRRGRRCLKRREDWQRRALRPMKILVAGHSSGSGTCWGNPGGRLENCPSQRP